MDKAGLFLKSITMVVKVSFCSLHFYTTLSSWTKAAKTMQLHTSPSYQKNTQT